LTYFKAVSGFKYYNEKFMKKAQLIFFLVFSSSWLPAQIILTIEGTEINDTITGASNGINILRSQPTIFTFRNNAIQSVNATGYMLQAGDETPGYFNNNLDGEIITGNKFIWNGASDVSTTHALFTGYNVDVVIKYNYLYKTPNGIQRKSDGMTDISGVIAYNIVNNPGVGIVVKGMNGVRIYNNTLYSEKTPMQTSRGLIDIHSNTDGELNAASTGTKVFNNIFYTKYETYCINVLDPESLIGFESDYNIFYCETGSVRFSAGGSDKTFAEWQALGYDVHSVRVDPDFNNFTDFIPRKRLDYGTDLGTSLQTGLALDATWGTTDPRSTIQNGKWQVGARIYEDAKVNIYPNPASDFFYVLITDPSLSYQTVKVYDTIGRVVLTDDVGQGLNTVNIPRSFPVGVYNIALESDNMDRYVRKLLIIR
jgi:hypothetical protein